ncbi:MAG: type 4a pilus biogenesis protein PilO [Planctomycetaceae bacterium]
MPLAVVGVISAATNQQLDELQLNRLRIEHLDDLKPTAPGPTRQAARSTADPESATTKIELTGTAINDAAVGQFINNLRSAGLFSVVELVSRRPSRRRWVRPVNFASAAPSESHRDQPLRSTMSSIHWTPREQREGRLRQWLMYLGAAAIGLLFWLLVIGPINVELQLEQSRLAHFTILSGGGDAVAAQQAKLSRRLDELRHQQAEAAGRIPAEAREDDFLKLLSEHARASELRIQDFRPMGILQTPTHDQMRVRLSGEAEYEAVCRFLDALRSADRMTRVTMFEVSVADAQRRRCSVDLTLDIFFNERMHSAAATVASRPTNASR